MLTVSLRYPQKSLFASVLYYRRMVLFMSFAFFTITILVMPLFTLLDVLSVDLACWTFFGAQNSEANVLFFHTSSVRVQGAE